MSVFIQNYKKICIWADAVRIKKVSRRNDLRRETYWIVVLGHYFWNISFIEPIDDRMPEAS